MTDNQQSVIVPEVLGQLRSAADLLRQTIIESRNAAVASNRDEVSVALLAPGDMLSAGKNLLHVVDRLLLAHVPAPAPGVCVWSERDPDGSEPGMWDGACGAVMCFEDDGPEDGDYNFCHRCGHRIEARPYRGEGE